MNQLNRNVTNLLASAVADLIIIQFARVYWLVEEGQEEGQGQGEVGRAHYVNNEHADLQSVVIGRGSGANWNRQPAVLPSSLSRLDSAVFLDDFLLFRLSQK